MHSKILIAGGSHADIPIIQAVKKAGYGVITSGNNPDDLGHQHSDLYVPADYSDPHAVLEVAKAHNIKAIIASANDFSALSCAYVAETLGLPGHDSYETTIQLHHKDRFREVAQTLNLHIPKAIRITKSEAYSIDHIPLAFPVIVKPVDLTGGKGMSRIDSFAQFSQAVDKAFSATKKEYVVVEEYIQGSNHGYSTFLKEGKIVFGFMDDEHYFVNPYLVSGASTSLHYSKTVADQLNKELELLAKALHLVDGLLHVQFILRGSTPYIIEICRRTPGDLYVKLVEYATGFSMSDAIVKFALGESPTTFSVSTIDYITRHCVMSPKNGKICSVAHGIFASMIFDSMVFFKQGDTVENYLTYKAEIDFIRYADKEQMQTLRPILTEEIAIRLCK